MTLDKALHHLRVYMMKYDKCRNIDLVEVENCLLSELAYQRAKSESPYYIPNKEINNDWPNNVIPFRKKTTITTWPDGVA